MKSVLISIRPKWCEKIASGKKTIEVRKTAPKQVPFKCYIYCTSSDVHSALVVGDGDAKLIHCCNYKNAIPVGGAIGNGKVIGEFVCDKVDEYTFSHYEAEYRVTHVEQEVMWLNQPELIRYGKGKTLCGWHISDLKIYNKPKELSEFYTKKTCNSCEVSGYESTACMYDEDCKVPMPITRAPQSWQYVEEVEQ